MGISFHEMMDSNEDVALVIQGGGMRGTYSIAVLAELEKMGLTNRFNHVFGTSAGALNGAYFLAGQAREGVDIYVEHLSNKRFIDLTRIKRIIDIDYLVDTVLTDIVPLRVARVQESRQELHIGLTRTSDGQLVWADNKGSWPILESLRATAALPLIYGKEVLVNGDYYVDGGLKTTVPLEQAIEVGCRNIVVILTRPINQVLDTPNAVIGGATRMATRITGASPTVVKAMGRVDTGFMQAREALLNRVGKHHDLNIIGILPGEDICSRLTIDKDLLLHTVSRAIVDVSMLNNR